MFREHPTRRLIAALSLAILEAACLRDVKPPAPPAPIVAASNERPAPTPRPAPRESAHDLFISSLTCFGAAVYSDAFGVELREATATIDRACAPVHRVAAETAGAVDDEDSYLEAVRRAVERRAEDLAPIERRELLTLFDTGLHAVREARSPWGLGPWDALVVLGDAITSPALRDEARALATLLEVDRRLRNEERQPASARELVELEERLIERSNRLTPSDLRTALDGCIQRLRTMI